MPETFHPINTLDDLESAIALSSERPVVIFKHSYTCGLSAMMFESLKDAMSGAEPEADWFVLSVQSSRAVSSEMTTRFKIRHETPQALVLVGQKVVWHGSHYRATLPAIVAAIEKASAA
jgi:bacillithiol system protein YtxJ